MSQGSLQFFLRYTSIYLKRPVFLKHRVSHLVFHSEFLSGCMVSQQLWQLMTLSLWNWTVSSMLCFTSFTSVQLLSHVQLSMIPWTTAHQASLSTTNSQSLLKLMSTESVMPSNHVILCHPLFLSPSIFPSIRVFSSESVLQIRWPKYWSFSFSISSSNEYSGFIFFRIDWSDLLQSKGPLSLQHHSSKASIL